MIYKKVTIDTNKDLIIHPIGDLHIGSKSCSEEFIIKTLEQIPKEKEHRIILMGDLLDVGIKNSIGASVYEQSNFLDDSIDYLYNLLKPFAEQIDAIITGNHEERIYKTVGLDILKIIANKLDVEYCRYSGIITYSLPHKAYNIYFTHGNAGGGIENALRRCKNMSNKVVADIYLMGHCHQNAHTKRIMNYVDSRNQVVTSMEQFFVLTGHSLKYNESYAEMLGLEISPMGFPEIMLKTKGYKGIQIN